MKPSIREPTLKQRLHETLREREECSKTCMTLIVAFEDLIVRFKRILMHTKSVEDETMAEIAVAREREIITKARRGR